MKLNKKWGVIDKTGKEVVPCKYDEAGVFDEGLALVMLNGKWGFIDQAGEEVISCKYEGVYFFQEGLAGVKLNGKWGFIDKTGKQIIACKYNNEYNVYFSEGLAPVMLNGKYGFIDKTGKAITPLIYERANDFSDGLAQVRLNDKVGFIDKMGQLIIPFKYYYDNSDFHNGLAMVELNDKRSFIDKTGQLIIPFKYETTSPVGFSENLLSVFLNDKWGYIDKKGKEIIPLIYDEASDFSEGIAAVKKDSKWYLIQNPLLTPQTTVQTLFFRTPDPDIHQTTDQPTQELKVGYVANQQLQASDFSIYVNGQKQESKAGTVPIVGSSTVTLTAKLVAGKNTLEVKAGGKTTEKPLIITYNQGKCNLFVLTVGVPSNLKYTDEDANDLSDAFATQDNGNAIYGDVKQRMALINEKCAKSNILNMLEGLESAYINGELQEKDMILFFISSHGGKDDKKGFYAVCTGMYDTESNRLYASEFASILNRIPCKKLILIDACHSGAGTKAEPSALNNAIKEMSTNLNGVTFFASSQGFQLSQESEEWQNGAFTEAILEAFSGKADKNKDGIISLSELESYVVTRTLTLTNQKQKPIMFKNDLGDKPFFLVK